MASLRTAFLQSTNPASNAFYSVMEIMQPYLQCGFGFEDRNKISLEEKKTSSRQAQPNKRYPFKPFIFPTSSESLSRLINFNINSFSRLLDTDCFDYKDSENLVHVLQIEEQDLDIEDLITEHSYMLFEESDGYRRTQDSQEDDFSEVEEMGTLD